MCCLLTKEGRKSEGRFAVDELSEDMGGSTRLWRG